MSLLDELGMIADTPEYHYIVVKGMDMDESIEDNEMLDIRSPLFTTLQAAKDYEKELIETTDFSDDWEWQYFTYRLVKITTVRGDNSDKYKLRRYVK